MTNPTCFISYAWEDDAHKDWVRTLARALVDNGVEVRLDQWDVKSGMDLTAYMERSVRESDYVLLVCTPAFARKADDGAGGVGYEKRIVTGEIFRNVAAPDKFKPLLRQGDPQTALPSYLGPCVWIDFRGGDDRRAAGLEQLLREVHDAPKYPRPSPGRKPHLPPAAEAPVPPLPAASGAGVVVRDADVGGHARVTDETGRGADVARIKTGGDLDVSSRPAPKDVDPKA